jgi:hypothetical protein
LLRWRTLELFEPAPFKNSKALSICFPGPTPTMIKLKDTERSCVHLAFDGYVHKLYRGHCARQRLETEVHVLSHLRSVNCNFVPRLISVDREQLQIVQSNCGYAVQQMTPQRLKQLFNELRLYGVIHDDPELRNVTYRPSDGIFCVVDFEFATLIDSALQHIEELEKRIAEELELE